MTNTAIKVENLSKKYTIGAKASDSLRETIIHKWNYLSNKTKSNYEEFWALKDISFEVKQGEVLGIIGKNGAGKSTLLKILSRITEPTSGRFVMNGRVSSLLEVGTGFHPELTGRENIYLNGTILGMTRKEVKAKFNEIVDFSGVEKFIDTPVKHYSSGMYVRLAFAVSAHLEPEILIIDEVLAVGDAEFQKKCLGKMGEVAKGGRTVLFVSHNMQAVNLLCKNAILLNKGHAISISNSQEIIRLYNQEIDVNRTQWHGNEGDDNVRLLETKVSAVEFFTDNNIEIQIKYKVINPVSNLVVGFHLMSEFNYELAYSIKGDYDLNNIVITETGTYTEIFKIPSNTLSKGNYYIRIDLGIHDIKFICKGHGDLKFYIMNKNQIGCKYPVQDVKGYCSLFRSNWHTETIL